MLGSATNHTGKIVQDQTVCTLAAASDVALAPCATCDCRFYAHSTLGNDPKYLPTCCHTNPALHGLAS